ncbi:hypothetical protein B296_00020707 [Ensete ventricosum]|uniref:Uncharacterized protein n=1 Tax=Ensete ventricosum TaxID=4639 RepID=A0A426ZG52_ENSVE|nr:hypothetical protein B296_00020707 [Ensete ventricosum]
MVGKEEAAVEIAATTSGGEEKGDQGLPQGGELLAAVGDAINIAGQQLAMVAGRWSRTGEGGGSGVNERSAQQWLLLRAREAAAEAGVLAAAVPLAMIVER